MNVKSSQNGPWRLTFDTNPDLCNINCLMCEGHSEYNRNENTQSRLMNYNTVEKVINDVKNYGLKEIIPSTMGEPLLYPHFQHILDLIKKNKLKLNLTTNGTFPILGVKQWGKLILPVASDVKISINGSSKESAQKIMKGINFKRQLNNIKEFIKIRDSLKKDDKNNPTITFQVTYMERNLDDLPKILKLAIDLNINRFKGHHLWITHQELKNESLRRNKESIQKWNNMVDLLKDIEKNHVLNDGKNIVLDNVYKILNSDKIKTFSENWVCPFLGKEAWIAWDGRFNVCCSPENLRRTLGDFGNVNKNSFMDLWNSDDYKGLVQNWINFDVCKICNMRKPKEDIKGC